MLVQGPRQYPFKFFLSEVDDSGGLGLASSAVWDVFVEAELQSLAGSAQPPKLSESVLSCC